MKDKALAAAAAIGIFLAAAFVILAGAAAIILSLVLRLALYAAAIYVVIWLAEYVELIPPILP